VERKVEHGQGRGDFLGGFEVCDGEFQVLDVGRQGVQLSGLQLDQFMGYDWSQWTEHKKKGRMELHCARRDASSCSS